MNNLKYIYHIAFAEDWDKAQKQGHYEVESLESEGFIHASFAHQVLNSANLFFKNQHNLYLLALLIEKIHVPIEYENTTGGKELFPHIYGKLNLDAVVDVQSLNRDRQGSFTFPNFQKI